MLSPAHTIAGSYDYWLVALSVLISVVACYAALDLAGRVTSSRKRLRAMWLCGGAVAMGKGIWATHYVGMLAFRLPVPVEYDWPTVTISLLAAVFAAAIALFVTSRARMGWIRAVVGSIFMGGAIAGMHYIGMAAMRLPAMCHYAIDIVIISIVLAVAISFVALCLTFRLRGETTSGGWRKTFSAVVMGAAVPVMHYTGMAAVTFTPSSSVEGSVLHALSISSLGETGVIVVTFIVLGIAIMTSFADRRFSVQAMELESTAKRSRQILETCFDSFVGMDSQGRITDWNAQAQRTFGWALADIAGKTLAEAIISPRHRESYQQNAAFPLHPDSPQHSSRRFESKAFCRDGREIPIEITVSAATIGGANYSAAFLRDLSQRYRSEEKFRGFMESSSEAIVFVDGDGCIAIVNSQAEKLFGYSRLEMLKQKVEMLLPERLRGQHIGHRAAFSAMPKTRPMGLGLELSAVRKDGSKFPVEISLRPVETEEGTLIATVVLDITARKEKETALKTAHEQLEVVLDEVKKRAAESAKLDELLDILQSCQTLEEACRIAESSLPTILPSRSGALCLTSSSRNIVEAVAIWGEAPATERTFRPDDCWALRRGKVQRVQDSITSFRCTHVSGSATDGYVCVPLTAQGETLGVLFMECLAPLPVLSQPAAGQTESLTQQAAAAGERLSLALANLKLREILRTQSIRDPLTGLFNRRYMEETLERELSRARRYDDSVALLMFDIDHFKRFNDTFGHQAGDAILRTFGDFLTQRTRGQDVACRYGGEEFALILSGASLDAAHKKAEQLREDMKHLNVQYARQVLGVVTVSIGVSSFPDHATSEDLLRAADGALYRAKAEGRDRVVADQPHTPSPSHAR